MHSTSKRAPAHRCECCRWAEIRPNPRTQHGYSVACANPKCLRGQAGVGRACCCFEREPGTDDELERLPPLTFY